jgi:hypothetical protein
MNIELGYWWLIACRKEIKVGRDDVNEINLKIIKPTFFDG